MLVKVGVLEDVSLGWGSGDVSLGVGSGGC